MGTNEALVSGLFESKLQRPSIKDDFQHADRASLDALEILIA